MSCVKEEELVALRQRFAQSGMLIATSGPVVKWYYLAGRVYNDLDEFFVRDEGTFIDFMQGVSQGKPAGYQEQDCLVTSLYDAMKRHVALAARYERCGNTEGARYLRYVANMLVQGLSGGVMYTILPDK